MVIMSVLGVIMTALALGLARPIAMLFVRNNPELLEMTVNAFYICSFLFMFAGISIYSSSMFTAFGNGFISAFISFMRTIVYQISAVLVLPIFLGLTGVWLSTIISDVLAMLTAIIFIILKRKKYGYA